MTQKKKNEPVEVPEKENQRKTENKPRVIEHYTKVGISHLSYDHAAQWRKENPVDDMDIAGKTDDALKNEITRNDIRESRRRSNFARTFEHLLESPEFSDLKTQLEKCYASLPVDDRNRKVREQIAETAQAKGIRINNSPVGPIKKEDIGEYRKNNPKHAEWLEGLSRDQLESIVALRRMKSSLRLNSSMMKRIALRIEAQYPEIMANIRERFSKITEPFRSIQTNKVIHATGISLGIKP